MNTKKRKKIIIVSIIIMIFIMAVGFSLLSSKLVINATGTIDSTFKVLITDAYANEHNDGKNKLLSFDAKKINFKVTLTKPYDSVEYIFKVENQGSIDAVLQSIDDSGMVDSDYIKWDLVKLEEQNIENSDYIGSALNSGASHTFKLTIYFEESALAPPSEQLELNMELLLKYVQ